MMLRPSNDNPMDLDDLFCRFSLVRPVCAKMREIGLPEPVVQKTMGDLLRNLEEELDGEPLLIWPI